MSRSRPAPGGLRRVAFPLLAVVLPLLLMELGACAALRVLPENPAGDGPAWLVSQREAFAAGTYVPDEHALWLLTPGRVSPTGDRRLWGDEPLEINEHGHRSPSIPREKPPGVRRAMIVGGSHPMGMYVEARAMYAQALQRRLDATGARWQVINAAVSGHTTHQGLKVIEHHAAPFDPDVVIFDLGVNDNLPLAMDYAVPDHELAAAPSWATAGADVAGRFAAGRLAKRMLAAARRPAEGAIRVPRERGMQNAGALKALGAERGFEVLFLQQVMLEDMPGEGRGDEAGHIVCTREYPGLEPRVNLCDVFATFGRGAERYFVDTMHANEAGHAVIADAVFAAFEAQGWTAP